MCMRASGRRQGPAVDGSQSARIADEIGNGKLPINVKVILKGKKKLAGNPSLNMCASKG